MQHKYILGVYDDDDTLLDAVKHLRAEGYRAHEVFSPFPIHGLDEAMGLQDTRLHTAGFIYGATGTLTAVGAMTAIQVLDWPIIVGGKPYFSLPAFVPITFELTVLFAAIGMVITFYIRNGFSIFKPLEVVDKRATDNKFILALCCKQYSSDEDQAKLRSLLRSTGASEVNDRVMQTELLPNLFKSDEELVAHH